MTAGTASCRGVRAVLLSAAAAAAAVVVGVVVAAAGGGGIPGAAAQRFRDRGLSRSRGVAVDLGAAGAGQGRIINGRPVTANDAVGGASFITKLFFRDAGQTFFYCGGSLITPNKILTAAHCLEDADVVASGDFVRIGGLLVTAGFERPIIAAVIHPDYDGESLMNDVAVLTIGNPPTAAEYLAAGVAPAFFNTFTRFPRSGTTLATAGFGNTNGVVRGSLSPTLLLATVRIDAWSQCNAWWVRRGTPDNVGSPAAEAVQVCGGLGSSQATCNGDSGGPLFERLSVGGRAFFRVYGLVSYGYGSPDSPGDRCPTINPDYYATTSAARAFIRANT